jgi:hypothetical protein
MAFYQQIEDALRYSIHKLNIDLEKAVTPEARDHALEDRARVAIQMAVAGAHCGARYMGEATQIYISHSKQSVLRGSLQDTLVELLAQKRREIAERHALQLGENLQLEDTTHLYAEYMGTFGSILGLPGTENVIEHLGYQISSLECLQKFFQDYTVSCILEVVQNKIKTSNEFREQITDWLKAQKPLDWMPVSSELREKYRAEVEDILKKIEDREEQKSQISRLFASNEMFIDQDLVQRFVEKQLGVEEGLNNHWNRWSQEEFLFTLIPSPESLEREGLSRELLEWILVAQGIFLPQTEEVK